jgi:sugar lactone lactonase YvrE
VFVTGQSYGLRGTRDYATLVYEGSTGAELWVRRYRGVDNAEDNPNALSVSPDGSTIYITASSAATTSISDFITVAYDAATGTKVWSNRYSAAGQGDFASDLAVSPDGSAVFVTGTSIKSSVDYVTVAYAASNGAVQWVKRYHANPNLDDSAESIDVNPDGSTVYVTGQSSGSTTGADFATIAYDASTGTKLWSERYSGSGRNSDDHVVALDVSPDGSAVLVTGLSVGASTGNDYAIVAYDGSDGVELWSTRYNGPGNDYDMPTALDVRPNGSHVFVTGFRVGLGTSFDYATIAYRLGG